MNAVIYFLAFLVAVSFVISLKKHWENLHKYLLILILFIPIYALRFAPLLVGLEWRANLRSSVELITAILMVLWCVISIVLLKCTRLVVLTSLTILLCVAMLVNYSIFSPIKEDIMIKDGITVYVRESTDAGSLADVQYFMYVNDTFRKLIPVTDIYYNF